ncbi:MAG: prolyl oligopeptidase family serine peptidase [Phycisphaerae bacterium]
MKRYEITFQTTNSILNSKSITSLVLEPDSVGLGTGIMVFTHGWGSNRYQNLEKMEFTCERFNLICLSVEYRQSGYDFDPMTGMGADTPYDASFYQVFDVLNVLRSVLALHPEIDRHRLFHHGLSQGGHIALLSSVFAPNTFRFVYASCPITHLSPKIMQWVGRELSDNERSIRNVIDQAMYLQCPVFIDHGTADTTVPHDEHVLPLVKKLEGLGNTPTVRYYEGGNHTFGPTTTRLKAFQEMMIKAMETPARPGLDDFVTSRRLKIPCKSRTLIIDWSEPVESSNVIAWE